MVVDCVVVLLHPHRKLLYLGVWWNIIDYVLSCTSGTVCGLPLFLGELASLRVLLLVCGPAFGPLSMDTSGFSCHTPAADMIEWLWFGIWYLMDVIHVV